VSRIMKDFADGNCEVSSIEAISAGLDAAMTKL